MIQLQLATLDDLIGVECTQRIIGLMLDAMHDAEPDLVSAVERRRYAQVAAICRQLTGPGGTMGAHEFTNACGAMEAAAARASEDELHALLPIWRARAQEASRAFEEHRSPS